MRHECAWCGKLLSQDGISNANGLNTSHGICDTCMAEFCDTEPVEQKRQLDSYSDPVFLIHDDGFMQSANESALRLIQKSVEQVNGELGGDVLGCEFATWPGGCGNTEHCWACTIRAVVKKTQETRNGLKQEEAYLYSPLGEKTSKVRLTLSTRMIQEMVLMTIESMSTASVLDRTAAIEDFHKVALAKKLPQPDSRY